MKSVCALVVLVSVLVFAPVIAQKDPASADVLRAATDYVAAYTQRVSGVTLEEAYLLLEVTGGRIVLNRRITSDVVLVNLQGKLVALRDPFALDDNPLRARTARIIDLLVKPTQATWEAAQALTNEFIRYFADEAIIDMNEPTLPLQFLAPENHARVKFSIDGRKKIGGIQTVGLRFEEPKTREADYVLKTRGKAAARGRFWVDPATGRIHRTELTMESAGEFIRITVDYARDAALDLWLPASMVDSYEVTETVSAGMHVMGTGSPGIGRRSFDCRASYSNPRMTPIQLNVTK